MLVRSTNQVTARSARQGFTLLEVLVVVAIIVMLAGVGSFYVYQRFEEAKVSRAKMDVRKLAGLVNTFRLNNNDEIPGNLQVLTQQQPSGGDPLALPDEVMDPWSKPYQIEVSGDKFVIFTMSPKNQRVDNVTR
jgi:general secretion pathway protein G